MTQQHPGDSLKRCGGLYQFLGLAFSPTFFAPFFVSLAVFLAAFFVVSAAALPVSFASFPVALPASFTVPSCADANPAEPPANAKPINALIRRFTIAS